MDEAERLCDRIAVIDHGKVISLGSPAELIARLGHEHLIEFAVKEQATPDEGVLRSLPAVTGVRRQEDGYALAVTEPHVTIPALLQALKSEHLSLLRLTTRHASLEDVFVSLTGRSLRED
jgi:ABC-2 type transport system ATP-binding protein